MKRKRAVLLLGPDRGAISGVSDARQPAASARRSARELRARALPGRQRGPRREPRPACSRASPRARFCSPRAILRSGAAIVHVNTSLSPKLLLARPRHTWLAAKLCGAGVVYQIHGGAMRRSFCAHALLKLLLRATLKWPDVVVVLGARELEELRALVPPAQNIGADAERHRLRAGRAAQRAASALRRSAAPYRPPGARARASPRWCRARSRARSGVAAARLVIAGTGPELKRCCSRLAQSLGLGSAVSFAGPALRRAQGEAARARPTSLLLATHDEGLPYALLEGDGRGRWCRSSRRVAGIPGRGAGGRARPVRPGRRRRGHRRGARRARRRSAGGARA